MFEDAAEQLRMVYHLLPRLFVLDIAIFHLAIWNARRRARRKGP